jgi:hypothetical protein
MANVIVKAEVKYCVTKKVDGKETMQHFEFTEIPIMGESEIDEADFALTKAIVEILLKAPGFFN